LWERFFSLFSQKPSSIFSSSRKDCEITLLRLDNCVGRVEKFLNSLVDVGFLFFFPIQNFFSRLQELGLSLRFDRVYLGFLFNPYVFSRRSFVLFFWDSIFSLAFLQDAKKLYVFTSQWCLYSSPLHSILCRVKWFLVSRGFDFYVFFDFLVLP
jgi:hypothetical protein